MHEAADGLRPEQYVEQAVAAATQQVVHRHPALSDVVHVELNSLAHHLRRAVTGTSAMDAAAWSAYATELDRGLDELQVEIRRAAEWPSTADAQGPDPVEHVRTSVRSQSRSLELLAWRFSLLARGDQQGRQDPEGLEALLHAERELRRGEETGQAQNDLEEAMHRVRSHLAGDEARVGQTA
jgi:hypothetical protein